MLLPTVRGGGHRFYEALGKLLDDAGFDAKVEALCAPHYAGDDVPGRPSIAPGLYFRMLLVGYFEGIGSERGIAWRCADSISLRDFLKLPLHVPVPDSSTVHEPSMRTVHARSDQRAKPYNVDEASCWSDPTSTSTTVATCAS